jgi:hypothetical protein
VLVRAVKGALDRPPARCERAAIGSRATPTADTRKEHDHGPSIPNLSPLDRRSAGSGPFKSPSGARRPGHHRQRQGPAPTASGDVRQDRAVTGSRWPTGASGFSCSSGRDQR